MGFLSGLLAPALGAVGNFLLPGVGGAIGTALGGALGSSGGSGSASTATGTAAIADPFASQRPQYQQSLSKLMSGTFSPSDPSYAWRMSQGIDATNRGAAASGLLRSGNRLAALNDYAQGQASTEYSNQFQRLATLSGATIGSPSTAATIQGANNASSSAFGQQLGSGIGSTISNWLNPSSVSLPSSSLPALQMPALSPFTLG